MTLLLRRLDKTNPKMLFRFFILGFAVFAAYVPGQVQAQNPRVQIPFELHDKSLKLTEWAKQPMLLNPVALSFDYQGRLFVVETALVQVRLGQSETVEQLESFALGPVPTGKYRDMIGSDS